MDVPARNAFGFTLVDGDAARERLLGILEWNTLTATAQESGLPLSTVHRLANSDGPIDACTERAIMRTPVGVTFRRRTPMARVSGVGVVRRIQALKAKGFSDDEITAELQEEGVGNTRARTLACRAQARGTVSKLTHDRVDAVYQRLRDLDGGNARVRGMAKARGYRDPDCWDEDTIDDPDYDPRSKPWTPEKCSLEEILEALELHEGRSREVLEQELQIGWNAIMKRLTRRGLEHKARPFMAREPLSDYELSAPAGSLNARRWSTG